MKTLLLSLLAVVLFHTNIFGDNNNNSAVSESAMKSQIGFNINPEQVYATAADLKVSEVERKDVSVIPFECDLDQVVDNALVTNVNELDNLSAIKFKIDVDNVLSQEDIDKAARELTAEIIGFDLSLGDVVDSLNSADVSGLYVISNPVPFHITLDQVTDYTLSVDPSSL